jgi:predicted nucleic acid-binding protein
MNSQRRGLGDYRTESQRPFCGITGGIIAPMRIVLDTACLITAVRSSAGAAGEVVRKVFRGELVLLMDLKLGLEYRDVALRPEHLMSSELSKQDVVELIESMEAFAEPVEIVVKTRPMSPDPNDDMFSI